jgi:hypothetical protein
MKTIFLIIITVLTIDAKAQSSGVYLSALDFASDKLAYEINCIIEKHKIKLNEFLKKDYITVVHDKEPYNLKKNEIFGFQDCAHMTYRFVGKSHYVMLNPTEEIHLYEHTIEASKNQKEAEHYCFSISGSVDVKELTLTNLLCFTFSHPNCNEGRY